MVKALDFKLALSRPIKPTGGTGGTLATLGDAARFVSWMRKARPHWRYTVELLLKAAEMRKISDIEAATS
jgi:hypothetical protein